MRVFIKAPDDCTTQELYDLTTALKSLKAFGYEYVVARDYQELMNWEVTHPYLTKKEQTVK